MVSWSGSLVQSCCRKGGVLQTDIAVCGYHSQCSSHTGFVPTHECVRSLSTLLRLPAALYGAALRSMQFQFSGTPQKCGLGCACILCLPWSSSSGSQELDRRTLPGCGAPPPLRGPSLSFHPCLSGACTLCLAVTLSADVDHP